MSVLEIRNLHCSIRKQSFTSLRAARKKVLNEVSLTISAGQTVGLLGESGSGKSTLARCIAGLHMPDSGEILFDGINLFPQVANRRKIALEIQMLFQASSASLDPTMTIKQCLMEGIEARDRNGNADVTPESLLLSVGMKTDILQRTAEQLSGGQRQRVALARALAVNPQLLILDEPTSALDLITQEHILELLVRIQKQKNLSVLFITHDVNTAFTICDRIAILREGSIIEEGGSEELLSNPSHPYTKELLTISRHVNF